MKKLPIETRLLLWLAPPLVIICIITLFLAPAIFKHITHEVFDQSLLNIAGQLESQLFVRDGQINVDLHYFSFNLPETESQDRLYYKMYDNRGDLLIGFGDLPAPETTISGKAFFFDSVYREKQIRGVIRWTNLDSRQVAGYAKIVVAETTLERDYLARRIMLTSLAMVMLLFTASVGITINGVRQGIKPLKLLQSFIRKQSVDDLQPVTLSVPREVEDLVDSINTLILRVQSSLAHITNFNTDVSHQLRTPLAEMNTLLELEINEHESGEVKERLLRIHRLARSMTRTTQQLLMYAKAQESASDKAMFKKIDLVGFTRDFCLDIAPGIYENGQSLSFFSATESFLIMSDPVLLREMLVNIMDNVQKHAVNQEGRPVGEIRVSILPEGRNCLLSIEDQGPGMKEELLGKAFNRFQRGSGNIPPGSGLGLAIVHQVVERHMGHIELNNRLHHGLSLKIRFPGCQSPEDNTP